MSAALAEVPTMVTPSVTPQAAPAVPAPGSASPEGKKFGLDTIRKEIAQPPAPEVVTAPAKPATTPKPEAGKIATPAAEVPASEAPAATTEDFLKNMTPKSQARFLELAKKEGEKLAAEQFKKAELLTPEVKSKLETYEKTNAELLTELRKAGIERSPEFINKFIERPKAIEAQLRDIAKTYDIAEDAFISAAKGGKPTRQKLNEQLLAVGIVDQNEAAQLVIELQKIETDRAVVVQDLELAQKTMEEKRKSDTDSYVKELMEKRRTALDKDVMPTIDKELKEVGVFEGEQGEALREDILKTIRNLNDSDLERMSPADRAALITSALASKPLFSGLKTAHARIKELEGKLAKYEQSTPGVGGGTIARTPAAASQKTFIERAKAGEI